MDLATYLRQCRGSDLIELRLAPVRARRTMRVRRPPIPPGVCRGRGSWPAGVRCILLAGHTPNQAPAGPHVPSVSLMRRWSTVVTPTRP